MENINSSSKRRKQIPVKVKSELQKEIDSVCPFCGNDEVGHFEVHHIDENPSNNEFQNLLLLCPICHSKITKGDITIEAVQQKKVELSQGKSVRKQSVKKVNNFNAPIGNAVIGDNNNVTFISKPDKVKPKINRYPDGCIGADIHRRNYFDYLKVRYYEYKEKEVGKENMEYAVLSRTLKRLFKIPRNRTIYDMPIERFEELVVYMQQRIDGTKFAKVKGKGHRNYDTFEEHLAQTTLKPK